jgi:hypothetical protein
MEIPVNKCKIVSRMDKFLPQRPNFSIFSHFTLNGKRDEGEWVEYMWVCRDEMFLRGFQSPYVLYLQ